MHENHNHYKTGREYKANFLTYILDYFYVVLLRGHENAIFGKASQPFMSHCGEHIGLQQCCVPASTQVLY